jgi:flagellar FliL protein
MAEEKKEEGEEKTEAAPPAKSKKKLFIIIGGVVLLLVGIGVPLLFMSKKTEQPANQELEQGAALHGENDPKPEGADDEEELAEGEEPLGAIYPLETFVVNLQGGKFIRLQVQVEFAERAVSSRFYVRIVPIRDRIISMLSSKTQEALEGAKEKEGLKTEIKDLINEVLKKEEVKKVYFSQFIIQ